MANVFSNIGSGKKEEKKTKTKQSNLSSKITINKNTNSKSIQENLNKSSVSNPLSNSTQGSKVNVVNTKLSADTKTSKTDKAKVSNNKANNNIKVSVNNINNTAKTNNTKSDTSNKKTNIFDKYFTAEGVASLDDNSLWKKIATGMDKSNSGNNLMSLNSNNIGSGLSQETKQIQTEVENRTATEKLLNGEKSSKLGNYFNLDTGYQLDDEDKETIDSIGVVVDNRTGKQVDNEYVNKLYSDVDSKYTSINKQIEQLNSDYQNGKLTDDDYKLKYGLLENEWKDVNKSAEELKNYKYKSGKEYYEWLKENGTDEEIKSYEAYIGSYDDSMLDSLANSYKATLVDFANTPIEAIEMVRTLVDGDYDFSDDDTLSSNMRSISNELRTYTLNGKNGEGLRKYSLQTISSLMPMINDAIIFTVTGGALGWEGKTLEKGVSLLTNLQFGFSSAGETTRQRLSEGNSMEVSMANGIVHGAITGLVEGLNVGDVVNVVNLLTGAGGSVLGVGLLGMPNAVSTIASNLKSGLGEGVEEIAESFSDKYADKITNAILSALGSNERVDVTDTTWGKVGDEGLTDQCIMAFAGAILLGAPTTISTYIDSKAKYNAAIESKKYWQAAQEYFTKSGDTKNAQDCQSIISLIDQETRTYAINNEKSFAYEKASDVATPAPSVEDVMNMTANAFSLDVSDTIEQAEKNKATATSIFGQLQNELVNRGLFGINDMGTDTKGVDVETYVKMTPELRTKAKNLLTLANELGANYKIDNEFNIIDKNGKLTTMNLTDTQNGAHYGKGATDTVITNPFSNDAKNNSNILEETLSHEFVHTAKESGNYKNLENAVVKALGSEFETFKNDVKQLYGNKVHTEEELMDEVTAKWVEKNLGSEKFIQQLSNYNTSMFSRLYTGMKALLNIDGKSEVANEFFKSYKDIIDKAKKGTQQTFVGGHAISENGIAFNLSEFDKTGRDILKQWLIDNKEGVDASNVENDALYKTINSYYGMLKEMAESGDFPSFEQWSNWDIEIDEEEKPYFSCIVNNGEYKLNIDFSTVCKKRKVMDAVLNDLATKGILDNRALTPEEITHLRQIIKDNGLEVACKLCFVDAKRFNQGGWADSFINGKDVETGKGKNKKVEHVEGWNELVDRLIPEGVEAEEFNFANRDIEQTDSVKLHELSNSEVNQDGLQHLLEIMANTEPNTEIHRMAKALYNKPNLRKKLELGDLYASSAFMNIKSGDKDFYKLVNGHQGSAKPKIPFLEVRYDNEIIEGHVNKDGQKIKFEPEVARKVGGIRLQSFSDFMINTVFDYMEAIAQMDAKGLTAHSYTKVEDYVRLFGQTGMKINMSIIPKVADISDELRTFIKNKLTNKKTGALKPESSLSNRVKNDPMYQEYLKAKSTAGLGIMSIEEYNSLDAKRKAELIKENSLKLSEDGSHYSYYLFDDESFNWLTAKEIQDTEGYDANCGTICVGVSDEHIWKLLSDPDVKMVIPYHKSSLNPVVAQMMNIGLYNDYTTKQNTRYANGTKLDPKDNTFDFYADENYGMIATGYDVQKTTEGYLRWCSENNYLPKFDTFAYVEKNGGGWSLNEDGTANYVGLGKGDYAINENYYKTLIDFRAYDSKGNLAPQQEVKLNMPSNFSEIVKNGLHEHDIALGKQSETYPKIEQEFEDYINSGVHYSLSTDTDGRKLSDSQKEYFKNSKMVDENGNLKVMYHGTTDTNFTTFDPNYSNDDISLFFTDDADVANSYSGFEYGEVADSKEYQLNYTPPILNNVDDANRYLREIGLQLENGQKPNSIDVEDSYNVEFDEDDGKYHVFRTKVDRNGLRLDTKEDITENLIKRGIVEYKGYTRGKTVDEVMETFDSLDIVINAIRNDIAEEKGNYKVYLNLENPLIVDADFEAWHSIPFDMPFSDRESGAFTTREISDYAYNNSYDGVIFKNLYDTGPFGDGYFTPESTVAVVFDSNQIKAVNNRVPTSDNDIRYDLGQEYDSNGRQLSDEQKKYFQYSRVRTPNGDMLVMYHGTNVDFTEFDSSKIGTHGTFEGSGFNFTSSESRAKEYANGGNVMEGYLNITNPLSTTEKTISVEEIADIIKKVDPTGDDIISGYATNTSDYGTQEFVNRESLNTAQTIFEHANSDADIYSDLSSVGGSAELMNAFKEMGYDGVIHYNVDDNIQTAVVFDSNQIKSINNLNPTLDSDIRYSMSKEEIERDNKWVERTQKVIDDINQSENVELTIDDIDDILQQKQLNPRTINMIERTKKKMRETANEWVKGYDTIRAEYPNFSEETFKNAIYEILIEDGMSEETYNAMANTLSAEFSLEGADADVKQSIEDFIQEALRTFDNETRYQAGEYDKESLKKSIKINNAYESQTIDEIYQKAKEGSDLDRKSAQVKKDLQTYWQPVVDRLYQTDLTSRETKGKRADRKVSWWKTIDQNIFELANGSKEVYEMLKKKFRYELLDDAASTREKTLRNAQTNVIDKIKALGIVEGSKEDIGLQYFLEGHTEKKRADIDINSEEYLTQETIDEYKRNPYVKYTLEDLMKEFDYKMPNGKTAAENIVAAAEIMRNAYDQTYSDIIDSQIITNGDIEGKAEAEIAEKLAELNKAKLSMDNALAEIKKDGSKESTQAAFEILKKKYNKVLKEYNTLVEKNSSHDLTRRNLTPFRENYVHHIVKNNLFQDISSIFNAESNVPTELAGVSDYTSPNTAFSSFSMAQDGGRYTPTALGSYAAYMTEAADVLAYNPVILSIRQLNKDIKSTTKGNNLNRLSEYLNDYANILAGKRDNIDRGVQKIIGPRYMALIKKMNSYAKAAALTANIKSGLTQFANIPNGMAILESKGGKSYVTDMAKGIVDWVKAFNSEGKTAIDQSSFMTNRYFGFDTGKTGFGQSVKDATDWILTVGDKIGAETIWWSAYEQGNRLYSETGISPIQYADDVTRSAIASRTKEDMALTMQSQTINLLLPFQVENNNLYQTLKQFGASKHLGAIATYNVAAFIFNMIMKGLIGNDDEILPEVITPIYKETKKTIEDEQEVNDTVENIFFGEIAEYISLLPWGSTAIQLMFGDDSETVFGDYNPNRYGTTNIGLSGIGNLITDMKNHSEDPAQQVLDIFDNILEGYVKGGKQIMRTTEGLQSMGGLPDYKGGEIQISPINYTTSGQNVAYVNNQENILDWVRAALFGKWNTSEAQNYLDNDYDYLSKSEMNVFDTLQANSEGNDYENYLTAKDYKNKEEKSSNKDNKGTVEASTDTETEEKSLREELLEQGKYGSYKDSVRDAYDDYLKSWYKEEHEEDDEPKSFTQFANGYGLTSDDLKQDTYGSFYDTYKISEDAQKTFSEALEIENSKNALNKTIANSGATQRRVIYEQLGIYDQILEFIENNGLEYSDFGLTKTVVGYDQSDINKMLAKINGESYDGDSSGSSGKGSGSGSSSTASSKQLKAMKAYMSALTSNNNIFSALDDMTTIEDAKKNVEEILKDAYKG